MCLDILFHHLFLFKHLWVFSFTLQHQKTKKLLLFLHPTKVLTIQLRSWKKDEKQIPWGEKLWRCHTTSPPKHRSFLMKSESPPEFKQNRLVGGNIGGIHPQKIHASCEGICKQKTGPLIKPIWVLTQKYGKTSKSSILIGLSIINHPFWGTPIFGNIHLHRVFQATPAFEYRLRKKVAVKKKTAAGATLQECRNVWEQM